MFFFQSVVGILNSRILYNGKICVEKSPPKNVTKKPLLSILVAESIKNLIRSFQNINGIIHRLKNTFEGYFSFSSNKIHTTKETHMYTNSSIHNCTN